MVSNYRANKGGLAMTDKKQQCPEFPFFGATYPDARCIEGYLWDLDSDDNGFLTKGGEDLCPFCNSENLIQQLIDDGEGDKQELEFYRNLFWNKHNWKP